MPITKITDPYILTAGGGTISLTTADEAQAYSFSGTATLGASYVIQPSGTAYADQYYDLLWTAALTLNGNSVTIFGRAMTQQEALNKMYIVCRYNGLTAAWDVYFIPSVALTSRFYHGVTANTILAAGGTVSLNPALAKGFQTFGSAVSPTLVAGYTVTSTGTPQEGDEFYCLWTGGVIANGQPVTIFGETLSDSQVLNGGVLVHVVYSGSAWVVLEGATIPSSSIVSKSYAQLQTLVAASTLVVNTVYFVNDRNIWIKAIESDKFELTGSFKMLCPDYQDASGLFGGVWISTMGVPAIGDLYSYNNFMWENLTGAVGTAPTGDAVNWLCKGTYGSGTWKDWVNKSGSEYQEEIYSCEYDFTNDWVQLLHDKRRGNKVGGSYQYEQTVSNGFNVIDKFQWGNDAQVSNTIVDSVLNIVNTIGTYTGNLLVAGHPISSTAASLNAGSSNLLLRNSTKPSSEFLETVGWQSATQKTLFSVGLDVSGLSAQGSGKAIYPMYLLFALDYNSAVYNFPVGGINLVYDGFTAAIINVSQSVANSAADVYYIGKVQDSSGIKPNTKMKLYSSADATVGDSTYYFKVIYQIKDVPF